MLNVKPVVLQYRVIEPFYMGGMKRYAASGEVLSMDCLTADILVKYSVVAPLKGYSHHINNVGKSNSIVSDHKIVVSRKDLLKEALENRRFIDDTND